MKKSLDKDSHWDFLSSLDFCGYRLIFDAAEVNFGTFYSCVVIVVGNFALVKKVADSMILHCSNQVLCLVLTAFQTTALKALVFDQNYPLQILWET